ncbi:MAG: phenylacetate-CoA oxygenase subunit PaaJ [Blastochloris sp.]|nr:phenylacetate-CoA oxygenase subunit PaaJ [Blastochloris sp.]
MTDTLVVSEETLWDALHDVPDPELPHISLIDLGVILRVELDTQAAFARVLLMPTFLGCPALEMMRDMIRERLEQFDITVQVDVTDEQIWTSDRISEEGRRKLEEAGIAPPAPNNQNNTIMLLEPAPCPHCGSRKTSLESAFGPTLCRAIAHCRDCKQPFEQFKPL